MKDKMLHGSRYKVNCGATLTVIEDLVEITSEYEVDDV